MSFNGSGLFLINSTGQPVQADTLIESATFNAFTADVATGLSTCITKDGQTTLTANIPMAGFKLTGLGSGSANADSVTFAQLKSYAQNSTGTNLGSEAGTNTITAAATPTLTAYAEGQFFSFTPANTITGAATINIDSVGAKDIKKRSSGGLVALVAGDMVANQLYTVMYDGTQFVLDEQRPYSHGADIASAGTINLDTATGDCVDVTGTTTITAITLAEGEERTIRFTGALTLTNGASLVLPGGANITTAAGDYAVVRGYASGVVRCVVFSKASGAPVVSSIDNATNCFRLTLTTGTPVTTSDVATATTIYCAPYNGNRIALYSGSAWNIRTSAEFSLALGTLTANIPYDVFCYDNAGTPTLEFLAWTNDTTRATALTYQDGILSKTGDTTRRYMGSFRTISTTQTCDAIGARYLFNQDNRVLRTCRQTTLETAASWTYTTATWRQANANTNNQFNVLIGWADTEITANVQATANNGTQAGVGAGIGIDSTTVNSATIWGALTGTAGGSVSVLGVYRGYPAVGKHTYAWLEISEAVSTTTWYGQSASGFYQAGISGEFHG